MNEFGEAADIISSLTRKVIAEEGHSSNPGNPDVVAEGRSCLMAAGSLEANLKKTIDSAKKQDFTGTVVGLMVVAQDKGALEACGLKLDHTPLINAMKAIYPRDWMVVEKQLRAFGAEAFSKLYPGAESPARVFD